MKYKFFLPAALCSSCLLIAILLFAASGCRSPDFDSSAGSGSTDDFIDVTHTGTILLNRETGLAMVDESGFLCAEDLEDAAAKLRLASNNLGYSAALVIPDADTGQSFLVVAPDMSAAEMLNGFFFWLLDPQAAITGDPSLVLCIDRLFSESNRQAALADGLYSDPRVVGLLELSLQQLVDIGDDPEILTFILDCYRRDFSLRLLGGTLIRQTWQTVHDRIEVTYEAAILSTVSFRILPG